MPPPPLGSSLADYCYTTLRDRLVMLDIAPGEPINESALAGELEVGRTPLREALKRLETDHLVVFYPRRGTFATAADLSELHNLTEMRTILEPAGTRQAAEQANESQRDELRSLAEEVKRLMGAHSEARTLIEYDLAAHRAIYRLINNPHMRETLFRLDNLATRLWWSVIQRVPSVADHIAGHHALLAAVAEGAADQAEQLALEHVTEFNRKLRQAVVREDITS